MAFKNQEIQKSKRPKKVQKEVSLETRTKLTQT